MQIGANSLLIAAQHARASQPPAKPAQPAFEPLPLKQTATEKPAAPPLAQAGTPPQRPGAQLDIRV